MPHLRSLSSDSVELRKSRVRSLPSSRCKLSCLARGHTFATMFTFLDRGGMYAEFAFSGVSNGLSLKHNIKCSYSHGSVTKSFIGTNRNNRYVRDGTSAQRWCKVLIRIRCVECFKSELKIKVKILFSTHFCKSEIYVCKGKLLGECFETRLRFFWSNIRNTFCIRTYLNDCVVHCTATSCRGEIAARRDIL